MVTQVVGAFLVIGFFLLLNQVRKGLLGDSEEASKVFMAGSTILASFLVGLIFIG